MFIRLKRRSIEPNRDAEFRPVGQFALDVILVESFRAASGPRQRFLGRLGSIRSSEVGDRDSVIELYHEVARRLVAAGAVVDARIMEPLRRAVPLPPAREPHPELAALRRLLESNRATDQERINRARRAFGSQRARRLRYARLGRRLGDRTAICPWVLAFAFFCRWRPSEARESKTASDELRRRVWRARRAFARMFPAWVDEYGLPLPRQQLVGAIFRLH